MEVLQLGRSNDDSITFITIHLRVLHDPSGRVGEGKPLADPAMCEEEDSRT